jgi:hypothetical protein
MGSFDPLKEYLAYFQLHWENSINPVPSIVSPFSPHNTLFHAPNPTFMLSFERLRSRLFFFRHPDRRLSELTPLEISRRQKL